MPPKANSSSARPPSLLRRLFANTAWLIGGKGFGAVCSLVYLAILTRSLGVKEFGHFSLIFGTSQALIALAGFQSWRVVVRYGVSHVERRDWAAFGRLGMLAGTIDACGALVGCLIAYIAIYQFGDALELNPQLIDLAFWFNVAALWALVSAPTGIVRALDRFDLAVYVEALVPLGRLAAALGIWLTGPSLTRFLIAWALIDLVEAAIYWVVAKRLSPAAVRLKRLGEWRQALQDNPGVIRFFFVTHAGSSVTAAMRQGPLLAVGYFVGTSAAGLYRLAHQLAQGLSKLSTLLMRAAYAEITRAHASAGASEFRKLAVQTTKLAGLASAAVVALAVLVGEPLIALLGGEEFRDGYIILVPLTVASCFELAAVAFEPVLHARDEARAALIARLVGLAAMTAAILLVAQSDSAAAIAWCVAIGGGVAYALLGAMTIKALRTIK